MILEIQFTPRHHQFPVGSLLTGLFGVVLALASAFGAAAQSTVEPGDTLSISVVDAPELDRQAKVDVNGDIMLPQLGGVPVSGQEPQQIRDRIEALLIKREIMLSPNVVVEVSAYRPIYVGGGVAAPGAIPFEAGLTVRRALILAGDLEAAGAGTVVTAAEVLETRGQWRSSAFRLAQLELRLARLEAELEHVGTLELPTPPAVGAVSLQEAEAMVDLESRLLEDRRESWIQTQKHLEDAAGLLSLELDVLTQQSKLQEGERDLQVKEVESARTLLERGLIPASRLRELEREASALSRDLLENRAFAARARQNQATLLYERKAAETQRRVEIREEIGVVLAQKAELEATMSALTAALVAAGTFIGRSDEQNIPHPEVTIFRTTEGVEQAIAADMQTPIQPGDVLEVALQPALPE